MLRSNARESALRATRAGVSKSRSVKLVITRARPGPRWPPVQPSPRRFRRWVARRCLRPFRAALANRLAHRVAQQPTRPLLLISLALGCPSCGQPAILDGLDVARAIRLDVCSACRARFPTHRDRQRHESLVRSGCHLLLRSPCSAWFVSTTPFLHDTNNSPPPFTASWPTNTDTTVVSRQYSPVGASGIIRH